MKYQGNYFTGNLACQNLGDCSLCIIPTEPSTKKDEQSVKEKCKNQKSILQKLFEKTS